MRFSDGRNYCRCDAPDENGRRSECGLPGVQCKSCRDKDTIDALVDALERLTQGYDSEELAHHFGIDGESALSVINALNKAKGNS